MKLLGLPLASLLSGLLLPLVLFAFADKQYLVDPWENSPKALLFVFLAPLVAIVCGHLAILHSWKRAEARLQKYFAIGGLFLGYAGLLTILAYPILNPRRPHFEATAVGSLRPLNAAIRGFAEVHNHFPSNLSDLACEHGNEKYEWCIDSVLATGMKGAYRITYTLQNSSGKGKVQSYGIQADPTKSTPFTRDHFFTDETGLIRYENDKTAGTTSKTLD
jgi:hypothetical protein